MTANRAIDREGMGSSDGDDNCPLIIKTETKMNTSTKPKKALSHCLEQTAAESRDEIREKLVSRPEPCWWRSAPCFTLEPVLSPHECQCIIDRAEKVGFEEALVNVGSGRQVYAPDCRNSDRCIIDDLEFATEIFERIKSFLPQHYKDPSGGMRRVAGLNERMRVLRYKPGHFFRKHSDGAFARPNGSEESRCTVMIYLNGDFSGGHTLVFSDDENESVQVTAKPGLVFVFDHRLIHESPLLESGVNYAIRTDVMYAVDNNK